MVAGFASKPARKSYDVVIIGGAIMGSATAWFLTRMPDFDGTVLVLERDPTFSACSTAHTNSCIRQQFSSDVNVRVSQFAADFIKNLQDRMGGDPRVPNLAIQNFGYMYLADTHTRADALRKSVAVQDAAGAATRLMTPEEILAAYPFYQLDDILLGSHNTVDEGYWDGSTLFEWFRRQAREGEAEYVAGEVTGMTVNAAGTRVESVTLASGDVIAAGQVVNASGPRAALAARMAGIELPVEPRKRFTWIFSAETPLDRELPLTIDPSGVHVREIGGGSYQCGGHSDYDPAVAYDDFTMDHALWQDHIWPVLAARIPQFEAIRVTHEWAGHYAFNVFDHNAIIGPHTQITNFFFLNGFSGHGLQQSPAMGRGLAELLVHGAFQALDLNAFAYARIERNAPFLETAVI